MRRGTQQNRLCQYGSRAKFAGTGGIITVWRRGLLKRWRSARKMRIATQKNVIFSLQQEQRREPAWQRLVQQRGPLLVPLVLQRLVWLERQLRLPAATQHMAPG